MYLAKIYITLKPTVNDPQGLTIKGALHTLGFSAVQEVRAGKYIEIRVDEEDKDRATNHVNEMCRKLLANPVIENYRFELEQVRAA
jgi:phosphoribosylformylglycinamidine synthase PurS subunit